MLLVLLLGIADLGRVFSAGITIEAAARNAAEAAAQEYVQMSRGGVAIDYARLHQLALRQVCSEAAVLPNSTPAEVKAALNSSDPNDDPIGVVDTSLCPDWISKDGTFHNGMPSVATCVHDTLGGDAADCGRHAAGQTVLPGCASIAGWPAEPPDPSNGAPIPAGSTRPQLPYVEVRACYHFTTLFTLHMALPMGNGISVGDVYLQRQRQFVGGEY
jgi:hypothetical protein